jgi:hypothetical protein
LNSENTYSQLLISIAEYEKRIETLKKLNEDYKIKLEKLKSENSALDKHEDKHLKLELDEEFNRFREVSEKAEYCKLTEERVYHWMIRILQKLDRVRVLFYNQRPQEL